MTNAQATAKLLRTRKTIATVLSYGHSRQGNRVLTLVDRYNDLRAMLAETTEGWAAWKAMCAAEGSDPSHDGYDLLA